MPVPLPAAGATKLTPPDAAESRVIAGGVAAAVAPGGGLTGLQKMLIEAVTDAMTGFVVPAVSVPRLDPQEFAASHGRSRDAGFRARMLDFMLMCALVLNPLPEEVVERVESYARELNTDDAMLRVAQEYARGSLGLALVDFERSGYMETWDPAQSRGAPHVGCARGGLGGVRQRPGARAALVCIARSARGDVRPRGRQVLRRAWLRVPRTARAARRRLLAQHDWMHVLGHYGSTVESELEVFAFIARANDDPRAFSLARDGHQPVRDRIHGNGRRTVRSTTAVTCRTRAWRFGSPTRCGGAR